MKTTILQRNADVVVMDPWGAFMAGNELSDEDVRYTLGVIFKLLAECGARLQHSVVAIILNHSRNGLDEVINCCGSEAANYGRNSKAIFSVVRSVWNLRSYTYVCSEEVTDGDGNKKTEEVKHYGVEFYNAKLSDGIRYSPFAVEMQPGCHTYEVLHNFDHDVWQYELESMKSQKKRPELMPSDKVSADAKTKVEEERRKRVIQYLNDLKEPIYSKELLNTWVRRNLGATVRDADALLEKLINSHEIAVVREGKSSKLFVGLPKRVMKMIQDSGPEQWVLKTPVNCDVGHPSHSACEEGVLTPQKN